MVDRSRRSRGRIPETLGSRRASADGSGGERRLDHSGADEVSTVLIARRNAAHTTTMPITVQATARTRLGADPNSPTIHRDKRMNLRSHPGNGSRCVVGRTITLIHPDGSGRHDLPGDGTALNPSWSPDGTKLAYDAAGVHGWGDIYVSDTDGTHTRQVTHSPGYEAAPAWSPDGSQIVFELVKTSHGMSQDHADLYVMNADGSHPRPLVRGPATKWGSDWQLDPDRSCLTDSPGIGFCSLSPGSAWALATLLAEGRPCARRCPSRDSAPLGLNDG